MTSYVEGVWRTEVQATKVTDETQVSPVVFLPEGVSEFSLFVVASTAATGKVSMSPSSADAIVTGTDDVWLSVDSTLDAVGDSMVTYDLTTTPVALKVESLNDDETATLIVVGKRLI